MQFIENKEEDYFEVVMTRSFSVNILPMNR